MTLDRITVRNFKSIRDAEIELRPLNVVIGPNGAGKSNLIAVFQMLEQILEGRLQEYVARQGGASRLLHFGPKASPNLQFRFDFGRNGYSFALAPNATDTLFFEEERTHFRGDLTSEGDSPLGIGHSEARLRERAERQDRVARHVIQGVADWVVYHFHDTSQSSPPKRVQDVDDDRRLRPDASNLASFLFRMQNQDADTFRRVTEHVQRIAPFFASFRLEPLAARPDKIKLEWRHRNSDAYFDGASPSDGTLRFICLATLLLQPLDDLPSLILIDEPELGLHPSALTLLVEMLRGISETTQILVATQSVTLLDQLAPEEVIVASESRGESNFRRLDAAQLPGWLEDYAFGDLWLKNVLGGRPL